MQARCRWLYLPEQAATQAAVDVVVGRVVLPVVLLVLLVLSHLELLDVGSAAVGLSSEWMP